RYGLARERARHRTQARQGARRRCAVGDAPRGRGGGRRPRGAAAQGARALRRAGAGPAGPRPGARRAQRVHAGYGGCAHGGGDGMTAAAVSTANAGRLDLAGYLACFSGIVWREVLRFLHQRERFLSALVRPLVWLFIFAAGFRQVLGVSIIPPYETYVLYEEYITPGLMVMIQLFNGMQSSLSMVYDREMGNMRT